MAERGFIYRVENSDVFVSNRVQDADCWPADAYFSVTDTFVQPVEGKPFVWHPWNESRKPTPELYYACNKVLYWWLHKQKYQKIRLFCDAGSHRSVTVFGIFLMTYHGKEAAEIVQNRVSFAGKDDDKEWANPLLYAGKYLQEIPEDNIFLKLMRDEPLLRLDYYFSRVEELVKNRFG